MSLEKSLKNWQEFKGLDMKLKENLASLSEDQLEDAFYKNLEFGTAGMRGELGPGTNRMNIYTVRKAAEGLARYIDERGQVDGKSGVVVAYDSRHMSQEFAVETAKVMGVHGIPTYIFSSLRPTPELSFAVRYLNTMAGVVITASHNPPEYNGYKVYNDDGGQILAEEANAIIEKVNGVEDELRVSIMEKEEVEAQGLLHWIDEKVDQAYMEKVKSITVNEKTIQEQASKLKVVFTPLHGTANKLVLDGLNQLGYENVTVVEEQAVPDPEFSTVKSPNPEEHQAFELAIKYGEKVDADILIGTDPDADRLGVAVKNKSGDYQVLTGNQLGAVMLNYILSQSKDIPENGIMIKTIVTSELGRAIADNYGISSLDTLTGFKYIAEKIREFEFNKEHTFLFGYEESYGYLIGDFVRDKDAVQAAMLACEVAAFYQAEDKTLLNALEDICEQFGYYLEDLESIKLKGKQGTEQIGHILDEFRNNPLESVGELNVNAMEDYGVATRTYLNDGRTEAIDLPTSNVIKFLLDEDCWCCLRPSGTEPKIKFYFGVKGSNRSQAQKRLESLKENVMKRVAEVLEQKV